MVILRVEVPDGWLLDDLLEDGCLPVKHSKMKQPLLLQVIGAENAPSGTTKTVGTDVEGEG